MYKKHGVRKLLFAALAGVVTLGSITPIMANDQVAYDDVAKRAVSKYSQNGYELLKLSHPEVKASTKDEPYADGILDYLGDGKLGATGVDEGANGQGDRGQSYSWASVAYGDWLYIATLYNSLNQTGDLLPDGGTDSGMGVDKHIMDKVMDFMFGDDFFINEPDNGNPGGALVKINVKTGETKLLMSKATTGTNLTFRNAVEFNGKLYFCGGVNGIPSIYEINPKTDAFKRVYVDETMLSKDAWAQAIGKGICPAIRGMNVFKDYLVISCVGLDANPYIAVSKDPSKGFTTIASAWTDDTLSEKGELFGYPAPRLQDSVYGGSIWEMIEFNGSLYVAMCTGTPENSKDGGKTMQSFAIVRGDVKGDLENPANWTWTPVIGDKNDGAKYTFGIDPERNNSGACNMMVFDDHLYIGEYNDTEAAVVRMFRNNDFSFLANNLEKSVSLYRLDKDENVELVMGNATDMFPEGSLSGQKSGFGQKENQYIWQMSEFDGKLYVGTFDESSILYPIAAISNGDLLKMTPEEWAEKLTKLIEVVKAMLESAQAQPQAATLALEDEDKDMSAYQDFLDVYEAYEDGVADLDALEVANLPTTLSDEITDPKAFYEAVLKIGKFLEENKDWTMEEDITVKHALVEVYEKAYAYYCEHKDELPQEIVDTIDGILNNEMFNMFKDLGRILYALKDVEVGFDMFATSNGTDFDVITRDGLGDSFNQGLRVFVTNKDPENKWMCLGTANPFYGTQIWRLEGEGLNVPPVIADEEEEIVPINPVKPVKPAKPEVDKVADKEEVKKNESVQTGDNSGILAVTGLFIAAGACIYFIKRSKAKQK